MAGNCEKQKEFIKNLRLSELQAKKEVHHYKYLYSKQCRHTQNLQMDLKKMKRNYEKLEKKYDILCSKLSDMSPTKNTCKGSRKHKSWTNVTCERTKRQRINDYGAVIFQTIVDHVPQCKRANVSLSLGDKSVNYMWKCPQLQHDKCKKSSEPTPKCKSDLDHSYYSSKLPQLQYQEDDMEDIDYGTIFDSQGNWQTTHKRCIINVMDSYRISHEAYHELRHAAKGHFPPLDQIRMEKAIMSSEIPYTKHETVIIL